MAINNKIGNIIGAIGNKSNIPAIIKDANTIAWYDYTNNIKDTNNYVSTIIDKSKNNNNLLQSTTGLKPLYTSNGIIFDGIDDYMKITPFSLNKFITIYAVIMNSSTNGDHSFWDGNTADYMRYTCFQGTQGYGTIQYNGAITSNINYIANKFQIHRVVRNSSNSTIQIDETTKITTNQTLYTPVWNGFTLGSSGGLGSFGNITMKEIIIRSILDSDNDQQIIYNYLSNKYPSSLSNLLDTSILTDKTNLI